MQMTSPTPLSAVRRVLTERSDLPTRSMGCHTKRRNKMYYRVAIQVDAAPTWKWKSTVLSSLNILLQWLQYYRMLPHDRLRIFSSRSQEDLNEQLVRENQGLLSTS